MTKVKVVAIAKDESAYLPEWIFHHLYFGFDSIDIYVNNTSDRSLELSDMLSDFRNVNFLDGDEIFSNFTHPQRVVYSLALLQAKEDGFTHVIFLDIDEFWTPLDFTTDIKHCLNTIDADIISFEWFNKFDHEEFSPAIELEMLGEHHSLVKSILSLKHDYEKIDIHNSECSDAVYKLADGTEGVYVNNNQHVVLDDKPLKPYFITHRMFRSQLEYVSLLGRGRPTSTSSFKDNRNGYNQVNKEIKTVLISETGFCEYVNKRTEFFEKYITDSYLNDSIDFVKSRYQQVVDKIESASLHELSTLRKILKGVERSDVNQAFSNYLSGVANKFNNKFIDSIRDAAIALEKDSIDKSMQLMEVALMLRPNGPLLKKKVTQYKKILEKN